jgi:hypothetical protein
MKHFWLNEKKRKFELKKIAVMKQAVKKTTKATINKDIKSYENDPFVIKKNKESKAFLEKHGFPEELLRKR